MSFISEIISERKIPDIKALAPDVGTWEANREKVKKMLCEEEYGFLPPPPESISFEVTSKLDKFCAGRAPLVGITVHTVVLGREFSFPMKAVVPKSEHGEKFPAIVHINFRSDVPDMYEPTEELVDNGYAVFSFCYKDVTSDDGNMSDGLAGVLFSEHERKPNDPGKIMMWAWAAMRVCDYICTLDCIDKGRISVCGHSRLGKTALVTGAFDTRFACAYSNDSGCSGAALSRGKDGETVAKILDRFPYWFCENYKKYAESEDALPFDQHFLIALTAPRLVYVASAVEDTWADPASEYLSCHAASPVFELYGGGFDAEDRLPMPNDEFHGGTVGYHLRTGVHYFSRNDWLSFLRFIGKHN